MREALGEFEQIVLLAILQLEGDAYAARIVEEIERRTGRSTAPAAVYITLRRLEEKGLVDSWMSKPGQERGGKSRRCVKVTNAGVKGLRAARDENDQMWKGLEPLRKGSR
jgi:DNA-binding PadR family transcriptional regulator